MHGVLTARRWLGIAVLGGLVAIGFGAPATAKTYTSGGVPTCVITKAGDSYHEYAVNEFGCYYVQAKLNYIDQGGTTRVVTAAASTTVSTATASTTMITVRLVRANNLGTWLSWF